MKFYYAIAILFQMLTAFISGNRNKTSYMLHLWKNLLGRGVAEEKNNKNSDSVPHFRKSKSEISCDEYSFLLER
jgi:hypothetical protein